MKIKEWRKIPRTLAFSEFGKQVWQIVQASTEVRDADREAFVGERVAELMQRY